MFKGDRIRGLRKLKGISQAEMAELLNTTKQTISKYENGTVSNIPSDRLEAMAYLLDTTPEYILGWNQSSKSSGTCEGDICMNSELLEIIHGIQALNNEQRHVIKQIIRAFFSTKKE